MKMTFIAESVADFTLQFNKGAFPNQRFGQAFCNYFNITNPDLFYMESRKDAEDYIWLNLVK